MLDCLQLLHYHLGSQIPNIRDIRTGVLEACRVYVGLRRGRRADGLSSTSAAAWRWTTTARTPTSRHSKQLLARRVLPRRRRGGHEPCSTRTDPAPGHRHRIRARHGRLLFGAALQHPRRRRRFEPATRCPSRCPRTARADPEHRARSLTSVSRKNLQECYNDAVYYRDEIARAVQARPDPPARAVAGREDLPGHRCSSIAARAARA